MDYSEVAFIKVDLLSTKKLKAVSSIIQNIPYPLIVVFSYKNTISVNISPKRINKNDKEKLVVEESFFTKFIELENLTPIEQNYLKTFDASTHPFTNFLAFHNSYLNALVAFNASEYSGTLNSTESTRETLQKVEETQSDINDIISKIKKETNIKEKVNLNIELQRYKVIIARLKSEL
jgi:hypothetical protein